MRSIVWFRGKDLRVADHDPLRDAAESGEVIPLFVLDPYFFAPTRARELPHRIQFLLESLRELEATIAKLGSKLLIVAGKSVEVVPRLAKQWKADRVLAHRWVEPFGRERDRRVAQALEVKLELYEGETLLPPGVLRTGTGNPYSVFSQFARAFQKTASVGKPLPAPRSLKPHGLKSPDVIPTCEALGLTPNPEILPGGETEARARLRRFKASTYADLRNRMDLAGTSRLSVDLKFGTLSARQVWNAFEDPAFLNELLWREFTHSTLWDRPEVLDRPFRPGFIGFPWRDDAATWKAWVEGKTGYPVVDASARQLLGEGFVHNRARMISASFLTKHLLTSYQRGEAHYLKYLTDGDWAQNNAGWQWSAGCGCDAQPYFRIFNPVTQGERFDPRGDYVRRYVPELAGLSDRSIHKPWTIGGAPGYPQPIVDLKTSREQALAAFAQMRGK